MSEALPETVAAVDLGSNSFHMTVARLVEGQLFVIDRMKEMVRLAAGLDAEDCVSEEAMERALACLGRFGQRLRGMPPGSVRAVGTNTLRRAHNASAFISRAEGVLTHPIEVIAGREEARLIYLGVSHSLAQNGGRRLVIDIGGGSTELIIGREFTPLQAESLYMGCVSMSRQFFGDGRIRRKGMRGAVLAARQELEPIQAPFRRLGWNSVTGASGTILATRDVLHAQSWSDEGISLEGLQKLGKAMLAAGSVEKLALAGLAAERAPVFPGGVAILMGVFEALGITRLRCSDGALREGLLYDLIGRIQHEDVRQGTIADLSRRYQIDTAQAARVERTAFDLYAHVASAWDLTEAEHAQLLGWAARLHEAGLAIAHSQYHKHGAYVLEYGDLPGFSRRDQRLLALLVRAHRRKFPADLFASLPARWARVALRLAVLVRLAVVLHRSRSETPLPPLEIAVSDDSLRLDLPSEWLEQHPLTAADLEQESTYLRSAGIQLLLAVP